VGGRIITGWGERAWGDGEGVGTGRGEEVNDVKDSNRDALGVEESGGYSGDLEVKGREVWGRSNLYEQVGGEGLRIIGKTRSQADVEETTGEGHL
jgi:hypothetical protein